MKKIKLVFKGAKIKAKKDNIEVTGWIDVEELVNSLTVEEIEENVHEYEKLFFLMKDYFRAVEERGDSFFK